MGSIPRQKINFNPKEIHAIRWISIKDLKKELIEHPEIFTPWFEQAFNHTSADPTQSFVR